MSLIPQIDIYTDGGCHGNPGPGGWAFVIQAGDDSHCDSGHESQTTNNRMELRAVIEALKTARRLYGDGGYSIALFTDSQYVRGGITEWMERWINNGWKTSARKPVKNRELWQELRRQSDGLKIVWHWVRGHSGNSGNELCDSLVQNAIAGIRSG
ncbi:MAG: ribonuclease HI [Spirochaetaceae bacterium]|nr:MAG: ribonuclease HI [Spirochaetaceae bacterium]